MTRSKARSKYKLARNTFEDPAYDRLITLDLSPTAGDSDFTYVLVDEFVRFLDEPPYEKLRETLFSVEFEVVDRMLNLSEGICSELVFSSASSSLTVR